MKDDACLPASEQDPGNQLQNSGLSSQEQIPQRDLPSEFTEEEKRST